MGTFLNNLLYNFLIALGVILGASFFAGVGALLSNHPPLKTMVEVSTSIKIWAVAVALGGTFSTFEIIEEGLLKGEMRAVVKQILYIGVALVGANMGCVMISLLRKCGMLWLK